LIPIKEVWASPTPNIIEPEKIAALQENLIVLNDLQHEIERINSYRDDESKVFTFNETYYYALPLEEEEMNDHFYKRLETMFNECFHQNLSIKPDYSVIIQQNNEHVKKFVACEIYQHDSPPSKPYQSEQRPFHL
ncbi:hypothetical protein, partial [Bacteroides acidifaciens]|uniref:hypothetical protein n=1 Tax=Bacteroides acidifaciens TaxID=85831 RepID=UPI00260A096B